MQSSLASPMLQSLARRASDTSFPAFLLCPKQCFRNRLSSLSLSRSASASAFVDSQISDPIKKGRKALAHSYGPVSPHPVRLTKRHIFSVGRCWHCKSSSSSSSGSDGIFQRPTRVLRYVSKRTFRGSATTETSHTATTPLDAEEFQSKLLSHVSSMAESLLENGYYTTTDLLPRSTIETLRNQSISLRFDHNRFEASYSETIDESTGRVKERFDKEGVYACEPDGRDYYEATDLITYMSLLLQTLPASLNAEWGEGSGLVDDPPPVALSNESFNAKLAVTEHGGAKYPLHVDNPQGLASGDTRKLTCILYLNPAHEEADGGEIRLFLPASEEEESCIRRRRWETLDLSPVGGRLLVFWSDEIPHEVLPTTSSFGSSPANSTSTSTTSTSTKNHDKDRYALTIWIPTSDVACLHNPLSKFHNLKDLVFLDDEATKKSSGKEVGEE